MQPIIYVKMTQNESILHSLDDYVVSVPNVYTDNFEKSMKGAWVMLRKQIFCINFNIFQVLFFKTYY